MSDLTQGGNDRLEEKLKKCTWQDPPDKRCPLDSTHDHRAKDGFVWASLCDAHHEQLERDTNLKSLDVAACLSSWVRAGGGAKIMAARISRHGKT